jgi:predicted DNA-binding transcriptional regulator AlpA
MQKHQPIVDALKPKSTTAPKKGQTPASAEYVPDQRPSADDVNRHAAELVHACITQWERRRADFQSFKCMVDGGSLCDAVIHDLAAIGQRLADECSTSRTDIVSNTDSKPRLDTPLRDRFWTMPESVRLSATELAAALGKSRNWVYRHTSPRTGLIQLPSRKDTGGALVFIVGEVRQWLTAYERITTPLEDVLPFAQQQTANSGTRETNR